MTEEEAKTKWCPMVRLTDYEDRSVHNPKNPLTHCIGSKCMMWREAINGAGQGKSSFYCGLGGKP